MKKRRFKGFTGKKEDLNGLKVKREELKGF